MRLFGINIGKEDRGGEEVPGFYAVEPEVAGGVGENTEMDRSVHPPIVSRLHYVFDDWFGDVLVTSFPCYLVTAEAQRRLEEEEVSGASFGPVEVSTSGVFEDIHGDSLELPPFVWLKPTGVPGKDDVAVAPISTLILSRRALDILRQLGLSNAEIKPFRREAGGRRKRSP